MVEVDFAWVVDISGCFLRQAVQKYSPFPGRRLLSSGVQPVLKHMSERPPRRAKYMGF